MNFDGLTSPYPMTLNATLGSLYKAFLRMIYSIPTIDRGVHCLYDYTKKQCPDSLWNMFQQRSSISNYNTRNYRDLHVPKLNLELTKKGFRYSGIKAWNDIPVNIRELPSLRLFKTHLK